MKTLVIWSLSPRLCLRSIGLIVALAFSWTMLATPPSRGWVYGWGNLTLPNIPPGVRFKAISAGGIHTLAITRGGRVAAWGDNRVGQCEVPSGLTNAKWVVAGYDFSVAVRSDGTAISWGNAMPFTASGFLDSLRDVLAIAVGGSHYLALKADGTVVAWGDNGSGQSAVPAGLNSAVAIAAGENHSLALLSDGTVIMWGNQNGRVPGLTNAVAIAAGSTHSLALKADGRVAAWGPNLLGETDVPPTLGRVTAISAYGHRSVATTAEGEVVSWGESVQGQRPQPPRVIGAVALAQGTQHVMALSADGSLHGWGDDSFGEALVPEDLEDVTAVAGGEHHGLALRSNGTVLGWGYGNSLDLAEDPSRVPPDLTDVVSIAAGGQHCIAVRADGTVMQWGTALGREEPVLSNVVAVSVGDRHALALKTDGTVVSWGENNLGQLAVPAGLSGIVAISAGGTHSLALRNDGTVVAWGSNQFFAPITVPPGLSNVVAIQAVQDASYALRSDDIAEGWYSASTTYYFTNVVTLGTSSGLTPPMLLVDGSVLGGGWSGGWMVPDHPPAGVTNVLALAAGSDFYLALIRQLPRLSIGADSLGQMVISWPTLGQEWSLQATDHLPSGSWEQVSEPQVDDGILISVVVPRVQGQRFFKLSSP